MLKISGGWILAGAVLSFSTMTMACSSEVEEPTDLTSAAQTPARPNQERGTEEMEPCTLRHRAQNLPCVGEPPPPTRPVPPSAPPTDPKTEEPPAPPPPPPPPDPAAVCTNSKASQLAVIKQQCVYNGVLVSFSWTSAQAGNQFLDVAYDADALFNLDASRGFQGTNLDSRNTSVAQLVLAKTTSYAWRINTIVVGLGTQQNNWCPNDWEPGTTFTTITCP